MEFMAEFSGKTLVFWAQYIETFHTTQTLTMLENVDSFAQVQEAKLSRW